MIRVDGGAASVGALSATWNGTRPVSHSMAAPITGIER
jgi:hypothetical protein